MRAVGKSGPLAVLAALAMAFAMALTVFASSANAQPFGTCPEGTTLLVTFETSGTYEVGDVVDVGSGVTITVTEAYDEGELLALTFESETPIAAFVVKSSTDVSTEVFDPPVTSGTVETPGVGPGGQPQGISNVQFCIG